ncbi:MAG: right-handed parallel beta-helix repeat-containing protein [Acetivibrio sp.]
MRKKRAPIFTMLLLVCILATWIRIPAKAATNYKITPNTKPCISEFMNYHNYNNKTKHYYVLRSYLETLEKEGGGTLTLGKGKYVITNTLYVPSNVTLVFSNGVTIQKGAKTNVSDMPASSAIFQLIRPSNSNKSGVYGKYNGDKNIQFIGKGKVVFDMKYYEDGIGIIMGHNQNVKVKNITFQNMHSGHFIEMDASKKVVIDRCKFQNYKESPGGNKEAINLDTPDKTTNGWSQKWSKYDCTANNTVTIKNCTFRNLERAVGTHRYSLDSYHTDVTIENNTVEGVRSGFFGLNWKNPVIKNNHIKNANAIGNTGDGDGIFLAGVTNPDIQDNLFQDCTLAIDIRKTYYTSHDGPDKAILSSLDSGFVELMSSNKVINTPTGVNIPDHQVVLLKDVKE